MAWGMPIDHPEEARLERGLLAGVAAFRWAALAWMTAVLIITRNDLRHPLAAIGLFSLAVATTVVLTLMIRRNAAALLRAPTALVELAVGCALLACDHWMYRGDHTESFGSVWPLAGAMSLGIVVGPMGGLVAGAALSLSRWVGTGIGTHQPTTTLSLVSTTVFYALAGGVAGFVMRKLRDAELQISAAKAREEVARTLHDGVLQTLAVVQRRSDDGELAALAREQEVELRAFLFGMKPDADDAATRLREVAGRAERVHGLRAEVVLAEPLPRLTPAAVDALGKAAGEALNNAAKHGGATRVTIYLEPQESEVFCSVKDDGRGFDSTATEEGVGIDRSIRARIVEVGGRVEVDGRPGRGTEIRLWVPTRLAALDPRNRTG